MEAQTTNEENEGKMSEEDDEVEGVADLYSGEGVRGSSTEAGTLASNGQR